jgi:hypothetical protein
VRRFNGRGKDAEDYRDNVMGRLKKVKAAAKAGKPFAADKI